MPSALIGALRVQLGIDSAEFTNGLSRAQRQASTSSRAIVQSLSGVGRAVAGLTAGLSVMAAAKGFVVIADRAKAMEAQLRLATATFGSFTQAQEDSQRIAQNVRGGLVETTSLYGNFLRTSQELGRSQNNAAVATETFSKALKLGGAETAQINSATLQMGQALSSTTVQWEELGQILEASPRLGKVFTDYLGITRGELKKLAGESKLTNQMLFDALNDQKITKGINQEFRSLAVTFDEAMQQVENSAIVTFGAFDRGGEFSTALSQFVTSGGDDFAALADAAEDFGIRARAEFEGILAVGTQAAADIRAGYEALHDMFEPIRDAAALVFGDVRAEALSSREYVASLFDTIDTIRNSPANAARGLQKMLRENNGIDLPDNWFVPDDFKDSDLGGAYRRRAKTVESNLRLKSRGRQTDQMFDRLLGGTPRPDQIGNWLRGEGAYGPRRIAKPDEKKKKGKSAEQLAREAERKREQALRQQFQLDREEIDGKRDLLSAQRDLTTDYTDRNLLSVQIIDLDRAARDKQIDLDLALGDIDAKEAQRRKLLADQLAVLDRQKVWQEEELERLAGIDAIEDEAFSLRERALRAEAALAETAAERREVELRLLDLARAQEQKEIDRLRRGSMEDQQRADMRQSALNANYARERAGVMQQTRGPWETFLASLPNTAAKANEAIEAIAAGGVSDLVDGLSEAMTGARSLGDVFSQVAKRIIADLIRIQIQKAIVGSLGNVLGGLFGGGPVGFAGAGELFKNAPTDLGLGNELLPIKANLTGLAGGGTISVLGKGGLDTNLLSINGMPVARVNRGERIRVDPNATPANDRRIIVAVDESPIFRTTVREEASTQASAQTISAEGRRTQRVRRTMGTGRR